MWKYILTLAQSVNDSHRGKNWLLIFSNSDMFDTWLTSCGEMPPPLQAHPGFLMLHVKKQESLGDEIKCMILP